jgi:hypothetical protein
MLNITEPKFSWFQIAFFISLFLPVFSYAAAAGGGIPLVIVYDQGPPPMVGVGYNREQAVSYMDRLQVFMKSKIDLRVNQMYDDGVCTFMNVFGHISCLPEIGLNLIRAQELARRLIAQYNSVFDEKGQLLHHQDRSYVQSKQLRGQTTATTSYVPISSVPPVVEPKEFTQEQTRFINDSKEYESVDYVNAVEQYGDVLKDMIKIRAMKKTKRFMSNERSSVHNAIVKIREKVSTFSFVIQNAKDAIRRTINKSPEIVLLRQEILEMDSIYKALTLGSWSGRTDISPRELSGLYMNWIEKAIKSLKDGLEDRHSTVNSDFSGKPLSEIMTKGQEIAAELKLKLEEKKAEEIRMVEKLTHSEEEKTKIKKEQADKAYADIYTLEEIYQKLMPSSDWFPGT